jgi:hypothetical protein
MVDGPRPNGERGQTGHGRIVGERIVGETTILTTSEQRIGGATVKRDQPELTTDSRFGHSAYRNGRTNTRSHWSGTPISIVTREPCEK